MEQICGTVAIVDTHWIAWGLSMKYNNVLLSKHGSEKEEKN